MLKQIKIPNKTIKRLIKLAKKANKEVYVDGEAMSSKTYKACEDLIGEVLALKELTKIL